MIAAPRLASAETRTPVQLPRPLPWQAAPRSASVTVLTVIGGQDVPGPSADRVRKQLQYNGIAAETMSIELAGRSTGEAVLAAANAEGCDLLVKGAFTRNRLRQMIFGGATSHIMQHADLPLLMAH